MLEASNSWFNFGGRSAYLVYHLHKSGRKTSIIIIELLIFLIVEVAYFCQNDSLHTVTIVKTFATYVQFAGGAPFALYRLVKNIQAELE